MIPYVVFGFLILLAVTAMLFSIRQRTHFTVIAGGVVLIATLGLYHVVGAPDVIPALEKWTQAQQDAKHTITVESKKLQQDKKNLESWIRLGQAFAQTRQWQEASRSFKHAVLLSGGHADIIMAYARSQIMAAEGRVSDHAQESLRMVLVQKPEHEEARYYVAVRLLQDGKNAEAMKNMKALYHELPETSPVRKMINQQIGR